MERGGLDLMLAGVDPADGDGLELLSHMRRKHRQVPVILLFSNPMPDRAREALRLGALAVLRYPVPAIELRAAVMDALVPRPTSAPPSQSSLHSPTQPTVVPAPAMAGRGAGFAHPQPLRPAGVGAGAAPHNTTPFDPPPRVDQLARELGLVGDDAGLRQAIETAATIAPTRTPILIVGEPGTGKALLARMIHSLGPRRDLPLVTFDATSLAGVLAEHEGHGAYADALADANAGWASRFHQAHGGTLFLDEVTGLPDDLQAQLLRVLQEREFAHDGHHGVGPDVRFLISTSEDLPALVDQGKLRRELYYRISVICLKLTPLRHRVGDIEALADHFRTRFAREFSKHVVGFTRDALDALLEHDWPGNVGELEGVIRRAVVLCRGTRITSGHLASSLACPRPLRASAGGGRPPFSTPIRPLKEALEEPEKRLIIQALEALDWNREEAARVLDINRSTLYKKMRKYRLLVDRRSRVNPAADPTTPSRRTVFAPAAGRHGEKPRVTRVGACGRQDPDAACRIGDQAMEWISVSLPCQGPERFTTRDQADDEGPQHHRGLQ
jgi:two-component system response regulator HydG